MQRIIYSGENVNSIDSFGRTALFRAASNGNAKLVKALLRSPFIDVNVGSYDETAFIRAMRFGFPCISELIMRSSGFRGDTSLICATRYGMSDAVNMLKATSQTDFNAADPDGNTALIWSVRHGRFGNVMSLLDVPGIDVNCMNSSGDTALILAVSRGYLDVAKGLLSILDIHVNHSNSDGDTALILAARHGHIQIVRELLNINRVNVNAVNLKGETALFWATQHNKTEIKKMLVTRHRWRMVIDSFRARSIAIKWLEYTQMGLCAPGGAGRLADETDFLADF